MPLQKIDISQKKKLISFFFGVRSTHRVCFLNRCSNNFDIVVNYEIGQFRNWVKKKLFFFTLWKHLARTRGGVEKFDEQRLQRFLSTFDWYMDDPHTTDSYGETSFETTKNVYRDKWLQSFFHFCFSFFHIIFSSQLNILPPTRKFLPLSF